MKMDMGVIYQEQMLVLKNRFYAIHSNIGSQSAGYEFEKFIYDLFDTEELYPKAGYKIIGEQIDGAFSLDGTNYIYECKATKSQADTPEILKFRSKIESKLENTLGLFISLNGFKKDAITAATLGRRANLIFIDASHILTCLDMRLSLREILMRMQRHSSQTGRVYMDINDML